MSGDLLENLRALAGAVRTLDQPLVTALHRRLATDASRGA